MPKIQNSVWTSSVMKPVLILSAVLLVLWIFTITQSSNIAEEPVSVERQARIDSLRKVIGTSREEKAQQVEDNMFGNAFPVFVILIIGIGGLWWWAKKKQKPENVITNVVAEQEIGPGQYIKVVSLGDDYLILGVTAQNINLLKTLSKDEWNPENMVNPTKSDRTFISLFNKVGKGNDE